MRDIGIKKIVKELSSLSFSLRDQNLLDVFARDGSWQTSYMADFVNQVTAWEIDDSFKEGLVKNLPKGANVKIGDSHELIQKEKEKFDIIIFDNPMNCYGNNLEYCEHFDIIEKFNLVANDKVTIIYNVKVRPFNYEKNPEWKQRRNDFYGLEDTSSLSIEFLKDFYETLFANLGYKTQKVIDVKRPQETGLYQFASILEKK